MHEKTYFDMSNAQKIALLLIALGKKTSSEILANLEEDEIKELSYWIHRMPIASAEMTKYAVEDFYSRLHGTNKASYTGGKDYLFDLLAGSVGDAKARSILQDLDTPEKKEPPVRTILMTADPKQLAEFFSKESAHTTALMLYHVDPVRAAAIISNMPLDKKAAVLMALAQMEEMDPDTLQVLLKKSAETFGVAFNENSIKLATSIKLAASILQNFPKDQRDGILEKIDEKDPALVTKFKNHFFVFNEMLLMDDDKIYGLIEACNPIDLVLALYDCDEALKGKFYRHIPKTTLDSINRQLMTTGPVTPFTVQSAQRNIANALHQIQGVKR